ncbi:MAG: metal-dependent hydrolase [Desulfobacca sp. 4484_104]|nr:MAG: metal-dependent hydrolase [Desulfobacca sp. 4484_104]RLA87044.1 MAG: metal-dependent hydrolase [Deltaproteobacteria bacterium]
MNAANAAWIGKGIKITFYGHSAFKLEGAGSSVLIDPWLDNPLLQTPIAALGTVNLILVTHGHADHLGNTMEIAQKAGAPVVAIHELACYLAGKGLEVIGMNKGGTCSVGGVKVTMTQALHSSSLEEGGRLLPAGDPVGFVVEFANGFRAYHAGDTAVFKDLELIRELYHPELAMLPIGDHYVMSPAEAALACRLLRPKFVIPMHYGTFPVLTGTPETLKSLLQDQPDIQIVVLKPGETVE